MLSCLGGQSCDPESVFFSKSKNKWILVLMISEHLIEVSLDKSRPDFVSHDFW
jgi:hypothetical protein